VSGRAILIVVGAILLIAVGMLVFPVKLAHIQLPAEPIFHAGSIPVTNTMLAGWVASIFLLVLFWRGTANASLVPRGVQNLVEYAVEFLLGFSESVAGVEKGRRFFPLVATIFLFVITSNWMGLLPGFGTIGLREGEELIPILRGATSDLNTTLAIALVSVVATQLYGLRYLGLEYPARFINFREGPIGFYVGILELIAELAKVISFTFRLFGNIFAGEVLIAVMTFLVPWGILLPFYGLELFVGFVQAFVFAALTAVFMSLATTSHAPHGEPGSAAHH
jgi:F-type H+-transporting ATPase subunit a